MNLGTSTNGYNTSTYSYDYDNNGNIQTVHQSNGDITYHYDSNNQLIWEDNAPLNYTKVYNHDKNGNISGVIDYAYTTGVLGSIMGGINISYRNTTWHDLLTNYNGSEITYDAIGNPLQYRNGMNMTWQNGRQLASISSSAMNASYTYNGDGIRTSKTVNGVKTDFVVDGGTIVSQCVTSGSSSDTLDYLYDENGKAYGFFYDGMAYYYEYDGQGNVVSLLNHHGDIEANYTYDSWGKLISVSDCNGNEITDPNAVANLNVFRYRGYCYDNETGLYYLQSRYYDPTTGRFINADGTIGANEDIISYNLFAYCSNNPVMHSDENGCGFKVMKTEKVDSDTVEGNSNHDYYIIGILNTDICYGDGMGCKCYCFLADTYTDKHNHRFVSLTSYNSNENYTDVYGNLLNDGGEAYLAIATYAVYEMEFGESPKGRTVSGIDAEIQCHYILYTEGILREHTENPDIGSADEDWNANYWELFRGKSNASEIFKRLDWDEGNWYGD